ncbi:MAG: PAS domain S-box protein, partial [Halapricum sp.]
MATGQTPHVVVAGALPSTVGAASAVCDRLRDTGLVVSRAAACGRARRRITDGRADVLLVAGTEDGADELVATAGEKGTPCCVVGDVAAPSTDTDVVTVTASGPDPVARLAGVLHELATDEAKPTNEPALEEVAASVHAAVEPDGTPPSTAQVLDEAPVGITVSDMRQPDEPLVYVNDQFVEQTGYSHEAALGRNCRFLQGPATTAESVERMRDAIDAGESVTVEIRNYTRSGELFWQEVSLAPIRDGAGNITHYAGFQADVTRRKRAERAADRHRAALAEERETFQSLLQRLGGVVEQ